jgi:hypothetical protein
VWWLQYGVHNPGVTVSGMAKYPGITEDYARTFKAAVEQLEKTYLEQLARERAPK